MPKNTVQIVGGVGPSFSKNGDRGLLEAFVRKLTEFGFDVSVAANPREAADNYSERAPPDIIFLTHLADAAELARHIHKKNPEQLIALATGARGYRVQRVRHRFVFVAPKPFDWSDLNEVLRRVLARRGAGKSCPPCDILAVMTLDECRRFYADEIRFTANIQASELVEAFTRVPREVFLGPGPWEIASADARALSTLGTGPMSYTSVADPRDLYHNVVVVLDKAADINNGQPSALARWIEAMGLKAGDRAFHLGCGVGYYTAIMAEMVEAHGSVVGIEVRADLAARARENLSKYSNVTVRAGDGTLFDPGDCDAMLINAGVTHPATLWLDRLRDGGCLVVPLTMATTSTLGVGLMTKVVRHRNAYSAEMVTPLAIYSCTTMRDPQREPLLKAAMTSGGLMKIRSVRRDLHEHNDTCIVHGSDVCLSTVAAS